MLRGVWSSGAILVHPLEQLMASISASPGPMGFAARPRRPPQHDLRIALCVPLGGTVGIWGPSALASARLAVAELNQRAGINGQACQLLTINAADDAPDLERTLLELVENDDVDALIGMHTSAVRQRILAAVGGQLPFVYTPLYEGGEHTPGVFAIGETTASQLRPAIAWLGRHQRPKRWMFIGNDYVWPHVSHAMARDYVAETGGTVVGERYLPLGTSDYAEVLSQLRRSRADAVLLSLIGQDAIEFNRAFGREGLARDMVRLSCAIGETELLGIGADNTDNLYVACGYFATLDTDDNLAFKERYYGHFGERAPTLNTFGQSTYEGVHFLAELLGREAAPWTDFRRLGDEPFHYRSACGAVYAGGQACKVPIYLAQAEGHHYKVIARL